MRCDEASETARGHLVELRFAFAAGLLAILAVGCGGAQTPAPEAPAQESAAQPEPDVAPEPEAGAETDAEPEPNYAVLPLPNADDIVPALKHGAESSGCALTAVEGQRIAVTCEQDTIFLEQVAAELRYACSVLGDDDCKKLLGVIIAAASKT